MALAIYDTVTVRRADRLSVDISGEDAEYVARTEANLVMRALRVAAQRIHEPLEGVELRAHNGIPHSRGLGSSAAAIVAGIAAAYGLAERELDADALHIAAEFEGHADNVAASLFGGLQLTWLDGTYHSVGFATHPQVRPLAFVPEQRSATSATRGLLPDKVPHTDAAFCVGRCALAVHALTADPRLLLPATEDRLHQDYRRQAWPRSMELVDKLRAKGVPATISGAGPTVLSFGPLPPAVTYQGFTATELAVDGTGVQVTLDGE
jgi:homoserine kinase